MVVNPVAIAFSVHWSQKGWKLTIEVIFFTITEIRSYLWSRVAVTATPPKKITNKKAFFFFLISLLPYKPNYPARSFSRGTDLFETLHSYLILFVDNVSRQKNVKLFILNPYLKFIIIFIQAVDITTKKSKTEIGFPFKI